MNWDKHKRKIKIYKYNKYILEITKNQLNKEKFKIKTANCKKLYMRHYHYRYETLS